MSQVGGQGPGTVDAITRGFPLRWTRRISVQVRGSLAKLESQQSACRPDTLCQFDVIPAAAAAASDGRQVGGGAGPVVSGVAKFALHGRANSHDAR